MSHNEKTSLVSNLHPTDVELLETEVEGGAPKGQRSSTAATVLYYAVVLVVVLVLFLIIFGAVDNDKNSKPTEPAELIKLSGYPLAKCLDSTPAAMYFRPSKTNSKNWIIYLDGGFDCDTGPSCDLVLRLDKGTSSVYERTISENLEGGKWYTQGDFISPFQSDNPGFYDANAIYVPYCTGDFYAGQRTEPVTLEGTNRSTYFGGRHHITAVVAHTVNELGLGKVDKPVVLIGGGSSGGIGLFLNLDYMADEIVAGNPSAKGRVLGVSLGGFYLFGPVYSGPLQKPANLLDFDLSYEGMKHGYEVQKTKVPEACAKAQKPGEEYKCMLANGSWPYVKTPMFLAQARTDCSPTMGYYRMPKMSNELLKATDINSTTAINAYKAWTNRMYNLLNLVMAKHGDTWGIFSPATFTHLTFVTRQHAYFGPGPRIEGFSFHQSLETWVGQRVNSTEWKDTNHGAPPHLIDACTTMMCGHPPAVPTDYSCIPGHDDAYWAKMIKVSQCPTCTWRS